MDPVGPGGDLLASNGHRTGKADRRILVSAGAPHLSIGDQLPPNLALTDHRPVIGDGDVGQSYALGDRGAGTRFGQGEQGGLRQRRWDTEKQHAEGKKPVPGHVGLRRMEVQLTQKAWGDCHQHFRRLTAGQACFVGVAIRCGPAAVRCGGVEPHRESWSERRLRSLP